MRGNKFFKYVDSFAGIPLLLISRMWSRGRSGTTYHDPKRILILKFSALGDAILLIPSLRALRARFPEAEVIFLGTNFTIPFLRQFPEYIDEFVTLDIGRLVVRPWSLFSLIRKLRGLRCDALLDFEQWMRLSAFLASCSGARFRAGFRTAMQYRHFAFTHWVSRDTAKHEVENFLSVAGLLTDSPGDRELEVKIEDGSLVKAQAFLMRRGWEKGSPIIIIHPGCGAHGFPREWPPHRYGELIRKIAAEKKALFIVTGTEEERPAMECVAKEAQLPVILYETSNVEDFVALITLSSLFISSNNGAMHLAAAAKMPQIALHGPTNPRRWGPLNPNAIVISSSCPGCPCLDLGFEYHRVDGFCMEQIGVEEVWGKAKLMLGQLP